jgi:hypothetical protein
MSGGVGGRLGQPRVLPESLGSDEEEPHPLQQSKKRPPFFPRRKNHLPQYLLRHISMPYTAIKVNAAFLRAHVDPLHRNQIREEPMETPTPPPIPPPIAPPQPPPAAPSSNEGRVIYNVLADKVWQGRVRYYLRGHGWHFLDPTLPNPCHNAVDIVWTQHDPGLFGNGDLQIAFNSALPGKSYTNPECVPPQFPFDASLGPLTYKWQTVYADNTVVVLFKAQKPKN